MVNMQIIPLLGKSFSIYAPVITVLVGLFTFFNCAGRILKFVGIDHEDAYDIGVCCMRKLDEGDEEKKEEGRKLVAHQLHLVTAAGGDDNSEEDGGLVTVVDTKAAAKALSAGAVSARPVTASSTASGYSMGGGKDTSRTVMNPLFSHTDAIRNNVRSSEPGTSHGSTPNDTSGYERKESSADPDRSSLFAGSGGGAARASRSFGGRYGKGNNGLDDSDSSGASTAALMSSSAVGGIGSSPTVSRADTAKDDLFSSASSSASKTPASKVYGGRYGR